MQVIEAEANVQKVINLSNGFSGIFISSAAYVTAIGMYSAYTTSTGSISFTTISPASDITTSTGNNVVKFTSTRRTWYLAIVFRGKIV